MVLVELIASILILIPRSTLLGEVLGDGTMLGAIFSHLFTPLGINVKGDGGLLFFYAVLVLLSSSSLLWIYKHQIQNLLSKRK